LQANEKKALRIGSVEWVADRPRMGFNGFGSGGRGVGSGDFSSYRRSLTGPGAGGGGQQSIGMSRSRTGESSRRLLDRLETLSQEKK